MIRRGMTLAQIQASRPTLDYDPLYGGAADAFVEAALQGLR
jgi:hypothetical protein